MKNLTTCVLLIAIIGMITSGCSNTEDKDTLFLYSGAGLREAVKPLIAEFKAQTGITVKVSYAGSETLLSSIKIHPVGDLYLPGDRLYVNQAKDAGLITDQATVCYFQPVILVSNEYRGAKITELKDLLNPDVKLGLGSKECAIGALAIVIFAKNNITSAQLDGANIKYKAGTVTDLASHISTATLDAVIVWEAIAAMYTDKGHIVRIPLEKNIISTIDIGILSCSKKLEAAQMFKEFITSSRAKEILEEHGYKTKLEND